MPANKHLNIYILINGVQNMISPSNNNCYIYRKYSLGSWSRTFDQKTP